MKSKRKKEARELGIDGLKEVKRRIEEGLDEPGESWVLRDRSVPLGRPVGASLLGSVMEKLQDLVGGMQIFFVTVVALRSRSGRARFQVPLDEFSLFLSCWPVLPRWTKRHQRRTSDNP